MLAPRVPRLPEAEQGHLLRNMLLFGRLLRAVGLDVTPAQIVDLVATLEHIDIGCREDFEYAAQAILVSRYDHLPLFHRAFDLFWQARERGELSRWDRTGLVPMPVTRRQPALFTRSAEDAGDSRPVTAEPRIEKIYTYSAQEVLRRKDFAQLSAEELDEVRRMMQIMNWELEPRRTRRKIPAKQGTHVDLRRVLRHNLRYGAEPLQLTWRTRKKKRRPLVLLCDISGSMERYSRLLLEFVYIITSGLDRVEAFVFGTRLTRITQYLNDRSIDQALRKVTGASHDWAGGTRIGESLKVFNYRWARRVLGQGAIVLIISDGWDRGDVDLLAHEMQRLQRSSHRVMWLNPLLGSPGYEPLARGIQAALPFVDDFLPVHNLYSLQQLGERLALLSGTRPRRRQGVWLRGAV